MSFSKALLSKPGTIFKMADSPPRITARRGGRAIKKILRSIRFSRGRGGVPIAETRNTTPAASIRRLRAIFLVTPPPLLAVMRGGEFALFKMRPLNHISLSRPRCTRLSTTPATLTWTDVPRRGAATQKTLRGGEGNFSLMSDGPYAIASFYRRGLLAHHSHGIIAVDAPKLVSRQSDLLKCCRDVSAVAEWMIRAKDDL